MHGCNVLRSGFVLLIASLSAASAGADITVRGTVYYWNGFVRDDAAGTIGAWVPAPRTRIQVETDHFLVWDLHTWTDEAGRYDVTFRQEFYRPDFERLGVDVEVSAEVALEVIDTEGPAPTEITVACYESGWSGVFAVFPLNGQTDVVSIPDGETRAVNVYVGPEECGELPGPRPGLTRLRITEWDHGDDGKRTTAGVYLTQCCRDEYEYLVSNCAERKDLRRDTAIFYPESHSDYWSPAKSGWINVDRGDLFPSDEVRPEERWSEWQGLGCTVQHEFAHKLMHDIYWTMPKPYPWGQGWPTSSDHDLTTCRSGELGLSEGWAGFLPAAVRGHSQLTGNRVFETATGLPHTGNNIEQAWYPGLPASTDRRYVHVPGNVTWRAEIRGRRDWNEVEVASVFWDIHDGRGWEYLPRAEQERKPAGWPGDLRWFERVEDPQLKKLWNILREEPECLNDEDESSLLQDSFWTFWLDEHGDDPELIHGLKAILHNREIRHTLKPENAPEILTIRALPASDRIQFADVFVREADVEDIRFLYFDIAYSRGTNPLQLFHGVDQPLEGVVEGDLLRARIRLPPRELWDRLILKVHDGMTCTYQANEGNPWQDDSRGDVPPMQLLDAQIAETTAIGPGGTVWRWGRGRAGCPPRLRPYYCDQWNAYADQVPGVDRVVSVATGGSLCAALKSDGTVWTWGALNNNGGLLGIGDAKALPNLAPNQVPGLTEVVSIEATLGRIFAVRRDGTVWGWGNNGSGGLGDGTRTPRKSPTQVAGLKTKITGVACRLFGTLAVDESGQVWYWGTETEITLLTGAGLYHNDILTPVLLPDLKNIARIRSDLALDRDGGVWEFTGDSGHLRKLKDRSAPGPVAGLPRIVDVRVGSGGNRVALAEDGTIWTWGGRTMANRVGELGDPDREPNRRHFVPAQAKAGNGWVAIAAGSNHGAALHQTGYAVVWGWGEARADEAASIRNPADALLPTTVYAQKYRLEGHPTEDPQFTRSLLQLFR